MHIPRTTARPQANRHRHLRPARHRRGTLIIHPPIAFAGTYTVHTCQTPAGTFTGTGGWTSSTSPPNQGQDPGLVDGCTADHRSMRLGFAAQWPVAPGHELRWSFIAPFATQITSLAIHRTFQLGWPVVPTRYGRPYVYETWHDDESAENQLEFELPPYGGDTAGVEYPPSFAVDGVRWDSLNVRLSAGPWSAASTVVLFRPRLRSRGTRSG